MPRSEPNPAEPRLRSEEGDEVEAHGMSAEPRAGSPRLETDEPRGETDEDADVEGHVMGQPNLTEPNL